MSRLLGASTSAFTLALPTAGGLTIGVGDPTGTGAFATLTAQVDDPAIVYRGGTFARLGTTFPLDLFAGTFDLTLDDGTRQGLGGTVAFRTDATSFDVLSLAQGTPSSFDVFVDGTLLTGATVSEPTDGSLRLVHVDFSAAGPAPGAHDIDLVYNGSGTFGGLKLPSGATLAAPTDAGKRIVFLGDSFTEGTGADSVGIDYAALTGRYLGLTDIWQSGFGGTGYETTLNDRPNLDQRILTDGVAAHGDIYVVAMGVNDDPASPTLYATVTDTLQKLVDGAPGAEIFVVADWNPEAPTARLKPTEVATIRAASAQFPSIHFLDPGGVAYTKVDPTHPDQAGHETLARWLAVQIENVIGPQSHHSADLVFQDTATSAVAGWQVAADAAIGGGGYGQPGAAWTAVATGDFAGTGETDIVFRNTDGTFATWTTDGVLLTGGGTIGNPNGANPGAGWDFLAAADFNGDGKTDLLFRNEATGVYATWDIDGHAIVGGGSLGTAAGYTFVAAGDLDGDGKADLLFRGSDGSYAAWLIDDDRIVGGGTIGNPHGTWVAEGLGDLNGDGKADIVFVDASGAVASWDMDGTRIIGGGSIGNPGSSYTIAKIADVDQDGRADLVFVDASGRYATWLMADTQIVGGALLGAAAGLHLVA